MDHPKAELHCHSHYSRGSKLPSEGIPSPRKIVMEASRRGFSVAITDHDSVQAWKPAREEARRLGVLFIPGLEISSLEGHVIALGLNSPIEKSLPLDETLEKIREQAGLAVAPHPFDLRREGLRHSCRKADAVEVFNSLNLDRFSNSIARRNSFSLPHVAGSDAHTIETLGNALNFVEGQTQDEVLKNIRKGKVSFQASYTTPKQLIDWSRQRLALSRGQALDYINSNYSPLKKWLSLRLLDKFIANPSSPLFTGMISFGLFCSLCYGGLKAVRVK